MAVNIQDFCLLSPLYLLLDGDSATTSQLSLKNKNMRGKPQGDFFSWFGQDCWMSHHQTSPQAHEHGIIYLYPYIYLLYQSMLFYSYINKTERLLPVKGLISFSQHLRYISISVALMAKSVGVALWRPSDKLHKEPSASGSASLFLSLSLMKTGSSSLMGTPLSLNVS